MELADVTLDIQVKRLSNSLILVHSHYVDKQGDKFSDVDTCITKTPIDISQHLSKNEGNCINEVKYGRIIGSLMYLLSCTRSGIGYIVNNLSRYMSYLGKIH